jgi:hypothetical protein
MMDAFPTLGAINVAATPLWKGFVVGNVTGGPTPGAVMRFDKIIRHTDGRCRSPIYRGTNIYGAPGWGKTHMNFLITIISPYKALGYPACHVVDGSR